MISTVDFPYDMFPIKLTHKEGKGSKVCYFSCDDHLNKYLDRSKLKKKDYAVKRKRKK